MRVNHLRKRNILGFLFHGLLIASVKFKDDFLYESFKCIVKQSLDSIGEVHSKSLLHRFVVDFQ